MTALVAIETVLLALLTLFVIALLRSHAEILRRLELLQPADRAVQRPEAATGARPAPAIAGATPSGGARRIATETGELLLAFLSSGCATCASLIDSVAERGAVALPRELRVVVITKDPQVERVKRFRPLEGIVDVVMSTDAWDAYAVPGSPYFVHVDHGAVAGEGSASAWAQVASLLGDAIDDLPRVDSTLAAAGIGPGHPSLRPSSGGADD